MIYRLAGDIANSNIIDIDDLALLSERWLSDTPAEVDIIIDNKADLVDFTAISKNWLVEK